MSGGGDADARRVLAADEDEETRYRAVSVLDPADARDREVLLERLADPSWRVRAGAVERIAAGSGAAAALPGLLAVLEEGPGVGAREAAAAALARIGSPAVPLLVERLGMSAAPCRRSGSDIPSRTCGRARRPRSVPSRTVAPSHRSPRSSRIPTRTSAPPPPTRSGRSGVRTRSPRFSPPPTPTTRRCASPRSRRSRRCAPAFPRRASRNSSRIARCAARCTA